MPYQKTNWGGDGIPDVPGPGLNNIERGLDLGYHVLAVSTCAQIMDILGDVVAFWPFYESTQSQIQDFSVNAYHALPSAQLQTWDTPPVTQGLMRAYVFNGTDEFAWTADRAGFTVIATKVFSLGAWVAGAGGSGTIMSKWDDTDLAEAREWRLVLDATGFPGLEIYDETANAAIGREDQTALSGTIWHFVVGVYDGGTDAANIKIYVDGVQTDDANIVDDVGFATMVNTATIVRCGAFEDDAGEVAGFFDGAMWGPFFTLKQLSAVEIWNLYQIGRAVLEQDLPAGMP